MHKHTYKHSYVDCPQAQEVRLLSTQSLNRHGRREGRLFPGEIYYLFNEPKGNRCTYQPCKFVHACSECWGGHPAAHCPSLKKDRPYPMKGACRRH